MAPASKKNAQSNETGSSVEDTQDLTDHVEGADDPTISSRAKDALFADAPKGDVTPQFQQPTPPADAAPSAEPIQVTPPVDAAPSAQPVSPEAAYYSSPDRPDCGVYDEDNKYAAIHDADFSIEETNKKGETA